MIPLSLSFSLPSCLMVEKGVFGPSGNTIQMMPKEAIPFIEREVYLSCGCSPRAQHGAGLLEEGSGMRRKELLAPA